ncbi:MAG TPA: nuclear transport factor 2 family protein [Terriglobales bacterium]|nr:nuclear transport factor 2 family protein [Terriglobales bacterium]
MDLKRLGTAAMTIVVAFAISAGSSFAAEKDDVVAAVHQYLDSLVKPETASAMCDSHVSILDEFSPHEWHGPTACADWWKAYNAYNEESGITDGDAPLGTPWTVDVTGDRAYFVAPMTYTYKQHGKPVKETASFAVALRRTQAGWRITGWAFSKQKVE